LSPSGDLKNRERRAASVMMVSSTADRWDRWNGVLSWKRRLPLSLPQWCLVSSKICWRQPHVSTLGCDVLRRFWEFRLSGSGSTHSTLWINGCSFVYSLKPLDGQGMYHSNCLPPLQMSVISPMMVDVTIAI
jgi:hypothetical protein